MNDKIDFSDVLTGITLGKFDGELDRLMTAIKNRIDVVGSTKLFTLQVGDKVKFNQLTRPKYLVGAVGTVKRINRSKVVIDLDQQTGKFFKNINTPTSMIETV